MAELQSKLDDAGIQFEESREGRRYEIRSIPQMVITDGNGDELGRVTGLVSLYREKRMAEAIVEQAESYRDR